ncbi:MAG: acetoacetate decarboxylase family protein [Defluviitaleaceae bacterium]|nr:acetoacetate decarboxylase family protein [Defluviitaleaceae bacterium]
MSSFFIPAEELMKKGDPSYSEMNGITAASIYAIPDPSIKALIPPPLQLADPALLVMYVSNINKPAFSDPYIEGGIGVLTQLADDTGVTHTGLYYFNLQLFGQGSQNATFMGREEAGLPKKFADAISLRRSRDNIFFYVERKGVRLLDARLRIGRYNDPGFSNGLEGLDPKKGLLKNDAVLTHRYNVGGGLHNMRVFYYNSPTHYFHYQPAFAQVRLQSSAHDPWGEIKIAKILGGSWSRNNNFVVDVTEIYSYPDAEALNTMQYLYAGRFDHLTIL